MSAYNFHSINNNLPKSHKKCIKLLNILDTARLDSSGGYPSDFIIKDDTLYMATISSFKDNAPELVIQSVDEFIKEYEELLEEEKS